MASSMQLARGQARCSPAAGRRAWHSSARVSVCSTSGRSRSTAVSVHASADPGLAPELKSTIDKVIASNKIVVFMKGTPQFPQCGFSNTVCQILRSMNVPFEGVNILADDRLRTGMKAYSQWPTFPQVYVAGEFVGGADILIQMYQSGELAELMERELNS